jgi:hypothetical protein
MPSSNYILILIKFHSIGNFAIYKETGKLLQFCKLLQIPSIGILEIYKNGKIIAILQIALYKNGQIIAILQIIKNPLYSDF